MGRELQKHYGQAPQVVLTMPLLEGLDGVQKMSKSLGNYVGITDRPGEMFNKIVSMPDSLMWRYFELLSLKPMEDVKALMSDVDNGANPRDVKMVLARELVARFHGEEAAAGAHRASGNQLKEGELPDDLPEVEVMAEGMEEAPIALILNRAGLANNSAQAKDMLKNARVWVDGNKVEAGHMLAVGHEYVIQAGKKRYARVRLHKG
jgi:tyrosyl-tRNA synthetase